MNNLLITMSGGTTSVINATLAGIIYEAQKHKGIDKIYAGLPGIIGFMDNSLIDLTYLTKKEIEILTRSPGSASIGTTRTKIFTAEDLEVLKKKFEEKDIKFFINIGGNGTIKQTKAIASHIKNMQVASAPKTVDNDLGDSTFADLWYTPGFPSCVNYWYHKMKMLDNENLGAYTNDKVLVAQTFGRETGFLVGCLRMYDIERTKPIILLIPEDQQNQDKVLSKIDNTIAKHGRAIVGICEGYKIKDYKYNLDLTGQRMYGSSTSTAMQQLLNLCNDNKIQARGFNPTIDQRQNFNFTLDKDIKMSYNIGIEIIKNFMRGKTHFFQSYTSDKSYKTIQLNDIEDYSRVMRKEWILKNEFDVSDKYIDYLKSFTHIENRKRLFIFGNIV
jgi:6-phosphofructokinase